MSLIVFPTEQSEPNTHVIIKTTEDIYNSILDISGFKQTVLAVVEQELSIVTGGRPVVVMVTVQTIGEE